MKSWSNLSLRRFSENTTIWCLLAICSVGTTLLAASIQTSTDFLYDLKEGYCTANWWRTKHSCCTGISSASCPTWKPWSSTGAVENIISLVLALVFVIAAYLLTMQWQVIVGGSGSTGHDTLPGPSLLTSEKEEGDAKRVFYPVAGTGNPEIRSILSGNSIPGCLTMRTVLTKAAGNVFSMSAGLSLGKEAPLVYIAACISGYVARLWRGSKKDSEWRRQFMTSCTAAGLSAAFGTPMGSVLFTFEELASNYSRETVLQACFCSLVSTAARYVWQTPEPYTSDPPTLVYDWQLYALTLGLGLAGGIFGACFCRLFRLWVTLKKMSPVTNSLPIIEAVIVTVLTSVTQSSIPPTKLLGEVLLQDLAANCESNDASALICHLEIDAGVGRLVPLWLLLGCLSKMLLTVITLSLRVPTGVLIPMLASGALFGRMIGTFVAAVPSGTLAVIGAGAFLSGVTRLTLSVPVIIAELSGDPDAIVLYMAASLTAKCVADLLSSENVYDIGQDISGHRFHDAQEQWICPPRSEDHDNFEPHIGGFAFDDFSKDLEDDTDIEAVV